MPITRAALIGLIVLVLVLAAAGYYIYQVFYAPPKEKVIKVAGQWAGPEGEAFQAALQEYAKKYGVKIEYIQVDKLRDYVLTQLQSGSPEFDIAIVPWPHFVRELAERGYLEDVSDVIAELKDDIINPYYIEAVKVGDKYYAVPIKMWIKGLWVNKEVLEKYGISLEDIKTIEGFKAACEKLKAAGIQPLASGAQDKWPLSDIFEAFILRIAGPELHQEMTHSPDAWKDPRVKEVFKMLAEFLEAGYWGGPERIGEKWEAQVQRLVDGEVAMYFMGNWITLFISNLAKERGVDPSEYLSKIVFVLPPEITPGVKPAVVGGGDWAILAKNAPNKEEAKKLIKWLGGPEYQELMVKRGGYLPTNKKVPKEAFTPADYSVIETIMKYNAEIVPDLDDNIQPSALQQEIWNSLYDLWSQPEKWEEIYNNLVQVIESQMTGGG